MFNLSGTVERLELHRQAKRFVAVFMAVISAVLFFAVGFFTVHSFAEGATTGEIDVVFLVDSSLSMKKNDPEFLRLDAMQMFVGRSTPEKTKIGIVLFSDEIVYTSDPKPIYSFLEQQDMMDDIGKLDMVKGTTDIGMALRYATDMLINDGGDPKGKFIVFLSDGKTVIPPSKADRTYEQSEKDVEKAIENARNSGIPIYTIGLNAGGDLDIDTLMHISEQTGANDTFIIESASDISDTLDSIFANHTGSEDGGTIVYPSDGNYQDTLIEITDNTVVTASAVVSCKGEIHDIKVFDPDGNDITGAADTVTLLKGNISTIVKIYYPRKGKWYLSVKATENAEVAISRIFSHDYKLNLDYFSDNDIGKGTKLKFVSELFDLANAPIEDEHVLTHLTGEIRIKDLEKNVSQSVPLKYDNKIFKGEFTIDTESPISIQAFLYTEKMEIRSEAIRLSPGMEAKKESLGIIWIILIGVGGLVVVIFLLIVIKILIDSGTAVIRSGSLRLNAVIQGMSKPPMVYNMAISAAGKKKIKLRDMLVNVYHADEAEKIIPASHSSKLKITMNKDGSLNFLKIKGIAINGGTTKNNKVKISYGERITIQYAPGGQVTRSSVTIQYIRA